jgi:DNA-binding transcriptional MerR regulator
VELVKIGELARRSGVPIATIKYYLREELIAPTRKSGRTMSWYDAALVTRIRAIKELQRRQFLPLEVIREAMKRDSDAPDELAAAAAIAKVLARHGGARSSSRDEVIARNGATAGELDWLAKVGLAVPSGADLRYRGDDLALLSILGEARKAGITADMLPFGILGEYLAAINALVAIELRMFRAGVLKRAKRDAVARLTTVATRLSERLVVLVRRKLLLPTLQRTIEEDDRDKTRAPGRSTRPVARAPRVRRPHSAARRRKR